MNPNNDYKKDVNKVIWNYDDIDMDILKVYDYDTLLGYFRIDTNIFTYASRRIDIKLLQSIMIEYDGAKNEAALIKEQ